MKNNYKNFEFPATSVFGAITIFHSSASPGSPCTLAMTNKIQSVNFCFASVPQLDFNCSAF